jgi:hypothetical protein
MDWLADKLFGAEDTEKLVSEREVMKFRIQLRQTRAKNAPLIADLRKDEARYRADGIRFKREGLTDKARMAFQAHLIAKGFPVGVVATGCGDDVSQLTPARRRCVPHGVSVLVRDPERDQLWIQPQPLCRPVGDSREVLQTDKSDSLSIDNQLTRVRGAHANHQDDVDIDVCLEQLPARGLGAAHQ